MFLDIQQFARKMEDVKAYKGSQTEIICPHIRGKPPPVLTWKKDNMPISDARFAQIGERLQIEQLLEEDTGNYTCIATNDVKSRNISAFLQVYSKLIYCCLNFFQISTNSPYINCSK